MKPREFWIPENWQEQSEIWGVACRDSIHVIEKSAYDKAIAALVFECGNRCAEQNPCNAKEVLYELGESLSTSAEDKNGA